jgi:ribonuclease T1
MFVAVGSTLVGATAASAQTTTAGRSNRTITLDKLPREAIVTLVLIKRGGPFPYQRDGITFENRERKLPEKARGYYREYTVRTPGESDRGARRIISGRSGERYYTPDHYRTFYRIVSRS